MMSVNGKPLKVAFEVKIKDKPVKLAVRPPSAAMKQHARLVHAKAYSDAVQGGAMLREELDEHLRTRKLWDDERQKDYDRLRKTLLDGEKTLARGGMRLKEAKQLALDMTRSRLELRDLLTQRNRVDGNTADAIADQAQFNYLVAHCTLYDETGIPVFNKDGHNASVDEYVENSTETYAFEAATKLSELMYGGEKDILAKLPENQFLKRFHFIDEDLHLVNAEGRRVDEKGRLVDAEGRYIDDKGEYVDADGNRVDVDGRFVVESSPFLDDDDKPIVEGVTASIKVEPVPEKGEGQPPSLLMTASPPHGVSFPAPSQEKKAAVSVSG